MATWDPDDAGVLALPSGRLVRARSLRRHLPGPAADLHLVLRLTRPAPAPGTRWVRWPDFGVPLDPVDARDALRDAWGRLAGARVEVGCRGGVGRTGTALACLAVLDGLGAEGAVRHVRAHHHPRAVETPWQRGWVASFAQAERGSET
ncbi:protein-tyrosine phosphatase family protein [Rhodococcus aerolatus]